jgi:pyruvate, water dikinase
MIHFLKDVSKRDVACSGGKGASLGELVKAGVNVPQAFVIDAKAFDFFLGETDLFAEIESQMRRVNHDDLHHVDQISQTIRDLIHDAKIPSKLSSEIMKGFSKLRARRVAIRSSATVEDSSEASWAGELESYLNISKVELLGKVKQCWASLYTPRAIVYRNEKGMKKSKISVAVVIQKMIKSEVAGVCFSVHPVTEDKNQMIIEAVWGLGEALVGGQITPDLYVVDKRNWELLDVNVVKQKKMIGGKVSKDKQFKQKLNLKQIIKLAKLCVKIEKHYRFPVDVEWCLAGGKFFIVQSRAITTL